MLGKAFWVLSDCFAGHTQLLSTPKYMMKMSASTLVMRISNETARCSQGIILLSQMKDKYDLIVFCMKNIILSLSGSCMLAELCYSVMLGTWQLFSEAGVQKRKRIMPGWSCYLFPWFYSCPWSSLSDSCSSAPGQLLLFCEHIPATVLELQSARRGELCLKAGKVWLGHCLSLLWSNIRGVILYISCLNESRACP